MIALLLAWGCQGTGGTDGQLLSERAYRVCHEPGFDAANAQAWCDLLRDAPPDRCPALRETCQGAADPGRGCVQEMTNGKRSRNLGGEAEPEDPPPQGCEPLGLPDLGGVQALLKWAMALGVAAIVLLLLRLLVMSFGRGSRPQRPTVAMPSAGTVEAVVEEVPEAPSTDQLASAKAALADGRYGEAVVLARGAALRSLGERGRLRLHRSRTDREYARSLRGDPAVGEDLAAVVRAHERHRFGGEGADRTLAERALEAAARILAVGVALVVLASGARAQTRYDIDGDAALLKLFTSRGYDAGYRLRTLEDLDEDTDALVLDRTGVDPDLEQWEAVRAWVEAGGVLLVAGDHGSFFPELGTLEQGAGGEVVIDPAWERLVPAPIWPGGGPQLYWDEPAGRVLVEGDAGAVVVIADVGGGVAVGISDARLLWNLAFVSASNEAFVGDLLYAGQGYEGWPMATPARVQLATVASAASEADRSNNPFRSVANARLMLFVLQLMLAWAVLALWRGVPFAPLRDPASEQRDRFVEHVHALGEHWEGARSSGWAARAMAALWLLRLGPLGLQSAARRAGHSQEEAARFAAEVERRAGGDGRNAPGDHEWMEELWRITRGNRE
ncbi:MAG: DUF4129 domain-containing protein [Alphaproteobacteria bacterium]|nr:DUF4129 domain-containing protein [Alphaproteobacteria bacterium]